MTPDEARARFSDAHDGELDDDERRAFEAALEAEPELRKEYASFRTVLAGARALPSMEADDDVDLLRGVKDKLRKRSGGRFYRDRFADLPRATIAWIVVTALVAVIVVACLWAYFVFIEVSPPQ